MPLLYEQPQVMTLRAHGALSLDRQQDFAFSRYTNAVPLNANEFRLAAPWYPIVFGPENAGLAMAVIGMLPDRNAFVGDDGQWLEADYIPAYVRRYPFIVAQSGEDRKLCIDVGCRRVRPSAEAGASADPLFTDGQPSALTDSAKSFCAAYDRAARATQAFIEHLDELGLLVERTATARWDGGESKSLSGFRVVDEEKFRALGSDAIAAMHANNWLEPLFAHLVSVAAWSRIRRLST
ncbi:SapC family protein [Fodinicurvata sp. EGI_FJ10296]|uniref:SapC family protein n=1 Tax=Fodinicurvata sp. EGI_FJ10296 TaxID=3231908 RepID=UPI0034538625